MHSDNSIHLRTAARRRHEHTRANALAALPELDRAGAPITFESVADAAGVSRSWLYGQTDLNDEIRRLRARNQPKHATTTPARQRASDDSLRQRLDIALRRNRELADENQQLARQLANALGQLRHNNRALLNPPSAAPTGTSSTPPQHESPGQRTTLASDSR
jgi:hypothetical protein